MSDRDLTSEEEATIIEDNKYLVGRSGYKNKYDMAEILAFGNIPEFDSDADAFICAHEVANFLISNGLGNHLNIVKFIESLKDHHKILFLNLLSLQTLEVMTNHPAYKKIMKECMNVPE